MKHCNALVIKLLLVCSLIQLASCSGGGGGGGGNGSGAETGVMVLHSSIDEGPIDLIVDDEARSNEPVPFAVGIPRIQIGGDHTTAIRESVNNSILGSVTTSFDEEKSYTLLLMNTGRRVRLIEDEKIELDDGQAGVRFVNGLANLNTLAYEVTGSENNSPIDSGRASPYVGVDAGEVQALARNGAGGPVLESLKFAAESGKFYTILVTGEAGYVVTAKLISE